LRYREQFDDVIGLAAVSVLHKPWLRDLTSEPHSGCQDLDYRCGQFVFPDACPSFAHPVCRKTCGLCDYDLSAWCQVKEPPTVAMDASLKQCECFDEGLPDTGPNATEELGWPNETQLVETVIVGRSRDEWTSVRPWLQDFLGDGRWLGLPQSRAPLTQDHWFSGSTSVWPQMEIAYLRVPHGNPAAADSEDPDIPTVRQYCYCNGIAPCSSTRLARGWFPITAATTQTETTTTSGTTATTQTETTTATVPQSGRPEPAAQAPRRSGRRPARRRPPRVPARVLALHPAAVGPPGRRLKFVPAQVSIVWGLTLESLGPFDLFVQTQEQQMWSLDPVFSASDPWAQRSIAKMIEDLPPQLEVSEDSACWISDYEAWLARGEGEFSFPSRQFDTTVATFVNQYSEYFDQVLTEDGKVKAIRLDLSLKLDEYASVSDAIAALEAWDDHVRARNAAASVRANSAWHTSPLWVRARAQAGLISSTAVTVSISVLVGFLAMLFFTCDCRLACLSMISSVLTILSLLFFMVVCLQWMIGAIEVVALIVFLGYLFSFNLHVSHAYKRAEILHIGPEGERFQRVRETLKIMGRSLVGSATTTAGCALFLLFCTLQFFVRFGIVILTLAALSLLYALVFLPVLLLMLGPVTHAVVPDDSPQVEDLPAGDEEEEEKAEGDEQLQACQAASEAAGERQAQLSQPSQVQLPSGLGVDDEDKNFAPLSPEKATVRPSTAPPVRPLQRSLRSQGGQKRSNSFGGVGSPALDPAGRAKVFQAHVGGGVTPGTVGSTEASVGGGVWVDTSVFALASEIEEEEV